MLRRLYIKDFAIVDQLEIEFSDGFQVMTGETGAGKSVIVGAIGYLCGERARSDILRGGASRAIIEAEFFLRSPERMLKVLNEIGVETVADTVILRREINASGVNRTYVNDTPTSVNNLVRISDLLIDLHGQHEHQRLIYPETHIDYLDAYARSGPLLEEMKSHLQDFRKNQKELDGLTRLKESSREKHALNTFQLQELEKAGLEEGELETLRQERRILENSRLLYDNAMKISERLYTDDASVLSEITEGIKRLEQIAGVDPGFATQLESLENARLIIEDLGRTCEEYAHRLEFDPERLEKIQAREAELEWLIKKYQVNNPEELIAYREQIRQQVARIDNFDEEIAKARQKFEETRARLLRVLEDLSGHRREAAGRFEQDMKQLLGDVGLKNARFEVNIGIQTAENDDIVISGQPCRLFENGIDAVEFNVGLNIGEPSRPLHKVASGGEISRIMLCIKSLLASVDDVYTLVFDEIDNGISGRVAQIVGKKLRTMSAERQLIVITHLPQIAALGKFHYSVIKTESDGRTKIEVEQLEGERRVTDLARLLGGEQLTEFSLANARELLGNAASVDVDAN
jgi:DNA repair protein RecN (Recombination protein N)